MRYKCFTFSKRLNLMSQPVVIVSADELSSGALSPSKVGEVVRQVAEFGYVRLPLPGSPPPPRGPISLELPVTTGWRLLRPLQAVVEDVIPHSVLDHLTTRLDFDAAHQLASEQKFNERGVFGHGHLQMGLPRW